MAARLSTRLILGFMIVIVVMIIFSTVVYFSAGRLAGSVDELNKLGTQQAAAGDLRFNLAWLTMPANDYIITGKRKYLKIFDEQAAVEEENFRKIEASDLTGDERKIISDARVYFEGVKKLGHEIFDIKEPVGNPKAMDLMEEMDYKYAHTGAEKVTKLFEIIKEKRVKASVIAKDAQKTANSTIIIGAFFAIIISFIFAVFLSRSISRPLDKMVVAAQNISQGNFEVKVDAESGDELGILANTFNKMTADLKQSFKEQKKLYDGEQRKVRQMSVLHEAVAIISSELELEPLLENLAYQVASLIQAELSALVVLHPETGEIQHFKANIPREAFPVKTMPEGRGLLGVVLKEGAIIHLDDVTADPRFEGLPSGHPFLRTLLGVPMVFKGSVIGGLFVANRIDGSAFTQEDKDLLFMFALQSATAIENARLYTKTVEMATTDGLTGLVNRRVFQERLAEEFARSERYSRPFSLFMIDIDYFKDINDTYGHQAGDSVLQSLGSLLKKTTRNVDIVARYGGEEFAVILPETDEASAKLASERVRASVTHTPFLLSDGKEIALTVSIGVAAYPRCGNIKEEIINRADQALYLAKQTGRNRVCVC